MVVTFNIPHVPGGPEAAAAEEGEEIDFAEGKYGLAVEEGKRIMEEVGRTLCIKDWRLFGPGG